MFQKNSRKTLNYISELKLVCTVQSNYYLKKQKAFFDIYRGCSMILQGAKLVTLDIKEEYDVILGAIQEFFLDSQYKFWHALNDPAIDKETVRAIIEWKLQIRKISDCIENTNIKLEARRLNNDGKKIVKTTTKAQIKEQTKKFLKSISTLTSSETIKGHELELKESINSISDLLDSYDGFYEEVGIQPRPFIPLYNQNVQYRKRAEKIAQTEERKEEAKTEEDKKQEDYIEVVEGVMKKEVSAFRRKKAKLTEEAKVIQQIA
eukprot:TRINITY_DN2494_c0_g1_i9.p1 TRINITY_DN2494_c0_g1~~TRINITY_DN2494_c0_g1_i9.p1  ORF type:complete len:263 (-),score=46.82 TRINITY_DN2494_c0_g1_i9:422-1210(-)